MAARLPILHKTPFVLDPRPLEAATSPQAGALAVSRAFRSLGYPDLVTANLQLRQRRRGHPEGQMIESLVLLQTVGGECPEDARLLAQDACLERGLGYRPPKATAVREFLDLFHEETLEATRPPREHQKSFIMPSSQPVAALQAVQVGGVRHIARKYAEQGQTQRIATIDQDATIIESHKQAALAHFEGGRGYQPMVAIWAEADLVLADEFRDGNVPARQSPLTCAQMAFAALPSTVTQRYFRGDSACHNNELLGWLEHADRAQEVGGRIGFAVSAVMSEELSQAVAKVAEKAWKTVATEADGTLRQWAEVDFVPDDPVEKKDSQPLRYVGLRLLKPQGVLFADGSDRHHHAVVSNLGELATPRWTLARVPASFVLMMACYFGDTTLVCRRIIPLLSLCGLVCSAAPGGVPVGLQFFRSEAGVASPSGPLPDRLDAPGVQRWRIGLEPGHSTPLVRGGRIFLTTYRADAKELALVALDERTGQLVWRRPVAVEQVEQTHQIGSPATATPACDGQRLFVFYGSYGLLCYDLDGNKLWEHRMGPFQDEYGAGSSPILVDNLVILNQDHDIASFLMAVEAATGKTVWKTPRPDAVRSYATPAVWTRDGHKELLAAGALELAGYAPTTGGKLWSVHGLARIVIPTPVPAGDRVYMASWSPGGDAARRVELDAWPTAVAKWDKNHDGKLARAEVDDHEVLDRFYRMDLNQDGVLDQQEWERHAAVFRRAQNALLAVKPSGRGELGEGDVIWKYRRGVPYVSTPLISQGRLWMVKEGGIVTKLQAADGHLLQEERLAGLGNYFASPVTGDGKVFFASENGVVSIVADAAEWRVISSHNFHEKIYASPVMAGESLFLRTDQALYCFQSAKP